MTIGLVVLMSLVLVVSFLIVLGRTFGMRRVLAHAGKVDVLFTIVACILLAGSVTGLLIGILAGLLMTVLLTLMEWFKRVVGAATERPTKKKLKPFEDDWEPIWGWGEL